MEIGDQVTYHYWKVLNVPEVESFNFIGIIVDKIEENIYLVDVYFNQIIARQELFINFISKI